MHTETKGAADGAAKAFMASEQYAWCCNEISRAAKMYWGIASAAEALADSFRREAVRDLPETLGLPPVSPQEIVRLKKLWPKRADLRRLLNLQLSFEQIRVLMHPGLTHEQREELAQIASDLMLSVASLREQVAKVVGPDAA